MTDTIEQKALAQAVAAAGRRMQDYAIMAEENVLRQSIEAHARAIEQHEAYRQEVSDAIVFALKVYGGHRTALDPLRRFIIAKPDPLVEVLLCAWPQYADRRDACSSDAKALRAALDARGLAIVAKEAQP